MTETIETSGGYLYEAPDPTTQPDVAISLSYADAYDVLLDGITSAATIEPLTEPTFKALAHDLLGLLIDASAEEGEEAAPLDTE